MLIGLSRFFSRVDRVLRRSLGVSEHAKPDVTVVPAPPKSTEIVESEPEEGSAKVAATDSPEDATVEDAHDDDEELPLHDEL
jgi:heat shock protein beta